MNNLLEYVREFHEAFKLPIGNGLCMLSPERHELRMSLIREEIKELMIAIRENDRVETLDAIIDLMYVSAGYAVESGVKYLNIYPPKHTVIRKMLGTVATFDEAFWLNQNPAAIQLMCETLIEQSITLARGKETKYNTGFLDVELSAALDAVHASNMAKLWTGRDISSYNEYRKLAFEENHPGYIFKESSIPEKYIAYRGDGKVMKPASWESPDLKTILESWQDWQKK
jgi:predicted HAD superfamily Cof-like phosphohydrolase